MGLFKKIFKPVRKVLDKVIPNEIKPFLPYAAAAVPFLAPTSGIFGTMAGRAALSGGANLLSQLAQEGTTEDDLNLLSTGIAALSGALTAPGRTVVGPAGETISSSPSAADFFKTKAQSMDSGILKSGVDLLGTGAQKVQDMGSVLRTDPFSKAGAKASILPLATGTGDAMYAETVRLNKQQIVDDALAGLQEGFSNADASEAIRLAMLGYGFSEDEISETISAAGYRAGGRVGLKGGGSDFGDRETKNLKAVEAMEGKFGFTLDDLKDEGFERDLDTVLVMIDGPNGVEIKEVLKSEALRDNLRIVSDTGEFPEGRKAGGRVGFRFGGIDEAIEMVEKETVEKGKEGIMQAAGEDPMLVEEYNKYVFDLLEQRPNAKPMSFADFKRMSKAGMKDGGLMDLGGKEMDLRGGGFVPIGKKEKADDVPARLSKNEFVMTADAVRAAGGGSVNEGAKRMYKVMNDLEARA
jgi:uncharacterized short protein YbdD (DUF466 family)